MYQRWAEWYYHVKRHHPEMPLYIEIMPEQKLVRAFDELSYPQGLQTGSSGIKPAELARASISPENMQAAFDSLLEFARQARKERCWNVVPVLEGHEVVL